MALLSLAALVGSCGADAAERPTTTLTVLAASSLSDVFEEIGRAFEESRSGVRVRFSFAASPALVRQVEAGSPADVIATADRESLGRLGRGGLIVHEKVLARNSLALVVPKGNPGGVRSASDLARKGVDVVLCAPEVPCGRLAAAALREAGLPVRPRSLEENARAVLGKVTSGEADAGVVYRTDARAAAADVEDIAFPEGAGHYAVYAAAAVKASAHPREAFAFVEFAASSAGQAILRRHGFLKP